MNLKERLAVAMVDELKRQEKAWSRLSEEQQAASLDRLEEALHEALGDELDSIAAERAPYVQMTLKAVNFTGGVVKLTGVASKHGRRIHDLADLEGESVVLVMQSANEWLQGDMPEPEPDQPALNLGGPESVDADLAPGDPVLFNEGSGERWGTVIEVMPSTAVVEHETEGGLTRQTEVPLGELRLPLEEASGAPSGDDPARTSDDSAESGAQAPAGEEELEGVDPMSREEYERLPTPSDGGWIGGNDAGGGARRVPGQSADETPEAASERRSAEQSDEGGVTVGRKAG